MYLSTQQLPSEMILHRFSDNSQNSQARGVMAVWRGKAWGARCLAIHWNA